MNRVLIALFRKAQLPVKGDWSFEDDIAAYCLDNRCIFED